MRIGTMARPRTVRLSLIRLESRENPSAVLNHWPGNFIGSSGAVNLKIVLQADDVIQWSTSPGTTPATSATGSETLFRDLTISLSSSAGNRVLVDLNGHKLS